MRLRALFTVSTLLVLQATFMYAAPYAADASKPAKFQLDNETEIPQGALKAGSYSIRIADHLADRMVIEIQNQQGNTTEKFLGVPAKNIPASSTAGPILMNGSKSQSALRGFSFSKGQVVEFVFPKNDAVALAKANGSTVLAIDPASEGMTETAGLSADDMKLVTLWMLTPTSVGPDEPKGGIKAARYVAPASSRHSEVAAVKAPVLARLPKTGSNLPLLQMAGLASLILALFFSVRRLRTGGI